jgi:hypothetical protein
MGKCCGCWSIKLVEKISAHMAIFLDYKNEFSQKYPASVT